MNKTKFEQKVCIIIPCFNEQDRLPLEEFIDYYNKSEIFFCFVNDGSTDETQTMLNKIQKEREDRILIVDQIKNQGKAEAVRTGISRSIEWQDFEFIGYWDADFSTPLEEIDHLLNNINSHIRLAMGSRVKRLGSEIIRNPARHYFGRIFATAASAILNLPVYDSQCGAKILRSDLAKKIFTTPFISKWLFDVEVLARIINEIGREESLKSIVEVPLFQWIEKKGSKIKFTDLFKVPYELLRIKKSYKLKKKQIQ
jgi:glycosyltransferase involved in cell wall biosynthesis